MNEVAKFIRFHFFFLKTLMNLYVFSLASTADKVAWSQKAGGCPARRVRCPSVRPVVPRSPGLFSEMARLTPLHWKCPQHLEKGSTRSSKTSLLWHRSSSEGVNSKLRWCLHQRQVPDRPAIVRIDWLVPAASQVIHWQ